MPAILTVQPPKLRVCGPGLGEEPSCVGSYRDPCDPWLSRGGASQLLVRMSVDFAGSGSLNSG